MVTAENGDAQGQFRVGAFYDYGEGRLHNTTEAKQWFSKSARSGNKSAQKKGMVLMNIFIPIITYVWLE